MQKIFDQGASNLLRKNKEGQTVFYPYGMLSSGYLLSNENQVKKISVSIAEYNKSLFKFLFVPVFASIIVITRVPEKYNWVVVSAVVLLMLFWALKYMRLVREETRNLGAGSNVGLSFKFDQKTIFTLVLFILYALGVLKLAEMVQDFFFL